MLPIQYTYLFGASIFLIPWATIFFLRKDLRPILVWIGLISIPLSLIAEYNWWTKDWWQPLTITNTRIGLEDVLLSFTSVGVSATLYLAIMKRKFFGAKKPTFKKSLKLCLITAASLILFVALFHFGINSFIATLIVFSFATTILLSSNPKLMIPAIISGGMTALLVTPIFLAMFIVTPNYVEQTWFTQNMLGIYPLGIPFEDILFYFVGGGLSFSAFPYITEARLIKLKSSKRKARIKGLTSVLDSRKFS